MGSFRSDLLQERRRIIQAAVSRFGQQGIAETSIQDIVQRSGLPPEMSALRRSAALASVN
jgi:AcrR family transcriptional regulator